MVLHSGRGGEPCGYVPSGYRTPDYRILDDEQRNYYFHWRSRLAEGECLHTDNGYVWIRLCEIANLERDHDSAMAELMLMNRECGYVPMREAVRSTILDIAIADGRDMPRIWIWGWDERYRMTLSEIMASPPDRIELDLAVRLAGTPELYYDDTDALSELVNLSLLRIDRELTRMTGKGIAETYGKPKRTDHRLFRGLEYHGDDAEWSVSYLDLVNDGFETFMRGLIRYSEKALFKLRDIRGPSAPSAFDNGMRRTVDRALQDILDGRGDDIRGPKPRRGTERTAMSSRERMLVEMGRDVFGVEDPFSDPDVPGDVNGRMITDLESRSRMVSRSLRTDMEQNRDTVGDSDVPYTPSGFVNPDYRSFDDDQRAFYLGWRSAVRSGRYPDTDTGYVWLYLCELINSEGDPREILRSIGDMGRVYESDDDWHPLIRSTYLEYAVLHGIDDVDPSLVRSDVSVNMATGAMLEGRGTLDPESFISLSGLHEKTMAADFDRDCAGITANVLAHVEKHLVAGGDDIMSYCRIRWRQVRMPLFNRLKYYGEARKGRQYTFEVPDFTSNLTFPRELNSIVKGVIVAVRRKRGKRIQGRRVQAFSMDCSGFIESETDAWFAGDPLRPRTTARREVRLDRRAVEEAQEALREVTGMMRVDEEPEEESPAPVETVPAAPSPPTAPGDPWSEFASGLSDVCTEYLRALVLGGDTGAILKRAGTVAPRVEDSINTVALDTVGDTVLEDGEVVEDYADDIGRVLGL
ncbi:MAG: TerB N-terminal domain-containing protein [Candidatus Methanomethylophilaceae archaeon]|nr:TerB N-terminal domain-containing protein [Candidatus Methanomethylophilaceae archaeon]